MLVPLKLCYDVGFCGHSEKKCISHFTKVMLSFLSFQSKACASVLLEQVCRQLNLLESDYFGLEYTDGNTRYWLDLEKPMNRQVSLSWSWERRRGWFLLLQNGGFWCGYQAYKGIGCGRDAWSGWKDYCIHIFYGAEDTLDSLMRMIIWWLVGWW